MAKGISVIVPIYNESDNILVLHAEIVKACDVTNLPYEIIFIDDGSIDNTQEIVKNLSPIVYIQFRKNFGQTAAMDAGIQHAKYSYIVTMDGDLQNDPAETINLLQYLEKNDLDVVSGWRKYRQDSSSKKFISRGANFLRTFFVKDGIHDSGCSLKIYKKECFDEIRLYGEMHRFIPALLKMKGFKIGEIIVNHRKRHAGETKYNWKRTVKGFIDMLSIWFWAKFASRPLHFFGTAGLIVFSLGILSSITTIFLYFERGGKIGDTTWPIFSAFLLLMGLMFFSFGVTLDMLSKLYRNSTKDKSYTIKEIFVVNDK